MSCWPETNIWLKRASMVDFMVPVLRPLKSACITELLSRNFYDMEGPFMTEYWPARRIAHDALCIHMSTAPFAKSNEMKASAITLHNIHSTCSRKVALFVHSAAVRSWTVLNLRNRFSSLFFEVNVYNPPNSGRKTLNYSIVFKKKFRWSWHILHNNFIRETVTLFSPQ